MNLYRTAIAIALAGACCAATAEDAVTTVKLAQEKLYMQGFYEGRIDGNPAGETQAAIAKFQVMNSLPADGSLDRRTLDALGVQLEEESASVGSSAPQLVGATPENPDAK